MCHRKVVHVLCKACEKVVATRLEVVTACANLKAFRKQATTRTTGVLSQVGATRFPGPCTQPETTVVDPKPFKPKMADSRSGHCKQCEIAKTIASNKKHGQRHREKLKAARQAVSQASAQPAPQAADYSDLQPAENAPQDPHQDSIFRHRHAPPPPTQLQRQYTVPSGGNRGGTYASRSSTFPSSQASPRGGQLPYDPVHASRGWHAETPHEREVRRAQGPAYRSPSYQPESPTDREQRQDRQPARRHVHFAVENQEYPAGNAEIESEYSADSGTERSGSRRVSQTGSTDSEPATSRRGSRLTQLSESSESSYAKTESETSTERSQSQASVASSLPPSTYRSRGVLLRERMAAQAEIDRRDRIERLQRHARYHIDDEEDDEEEEEEPRQPRRRRRH